jgi:tRNA-dihydrouridine synthase C
MTILLAPMEGLLDFTLRDILTRVGGIDRCVSEFIRVTGTLLPEKVFTRIVPELNHGGRTPAGVPVRAQLMGSDAVCLAENAARLAGLGPAGIDLNFGCPAKVVNRHGGGAALLADPMLLSAIVSAVRRAVPQPMPVSAKMRLGVHDGSRAVECALAIEEAGACELVVHGRTKADGMVCDPGLALAIAQPGRPAVAWETLLPLLRQFWQLVSRQIEPRARAGRLKQWLNFLRRCHPQAQVLYANVRTLNDPALVSACVFGPAGAAADEGPALPTGRIPVFS